MANNHSKLNCANRGPKTDVNIQKSTISEIGKCLVPNELRHNRSTSKCKYLDKFCLTCPVCPPHAHLKLEDTYMLNTCGMGKASCASLDLKERFSLGQASGLAHIELKR